MPTRNINVPLRLLVFGISLASALQYHVLALNVTTVVAARPIRTIERSSTAHPAGLLATTTPPAAAAAVVVVDEIIQDQIIGIPNRLVNETTYSLTGLARVGNSIKKGGGAAGSRGSGSSSGSGRGGSGNSSSNVSNGGIGNGMSSSRGSSSGSMSQVSSTNPEYPVWFPLGGGLFEPPPASANAIIGSKVALRAVTLLCGTVLMVYGVL